MDARKKSSPKIVQKPVREELDEQDEIEQEELEQEEEELEEEELEQEEDEIDEQEEEQEEQEEQEEEQEEQEEDLSSSSSVKEIPMTDGVITSKNYTTEKNLRNDTSLDLFLNKHGYVIEEVFIHNGIPVLLKTVNNVALSIYILIDIPEIMGPWKGKKIDVSLGKKENKSICGDYGDKLIKMVGYTVSGLVFENTSKIQVFLFQKNGFDTEEKMYIPEKKRDIKCTCFPIINLSYIKKIPEIIDPFATEGIQKLRDLITNEASGWYMKLENSIEKTYNEIKNYGDILVNLLDETMNDIRIIREDLNTLRYDENIKAKEDYNELFKILKSKNEIIANLPNEISKITALQKDIDIINNKLEEISVEFRKNYN